MRRVVVLLCACVGLVLAGCTGVPRSSDPSVVESLGLGDQQVQQIPTPAPDADQRAIVREFLSSNALPNAPAQQTLGAYFTDQAAQARWDPSTVTIIDDETVGTPNSQNKIEVTGSQVGFIDKNGVYTPSLSGTGATPFTATYGLQETPKGFRISTVQPNGLLLTTDQFATYKPYLLYFFDSSEQRLVPDPRWAPSSEADAALLMNQLAQGPRDALQSDATVNELPPTSNPSNVVVTTLTTGPARGLTRIEVPGARQLSVSNRDLLAAQIANTLAQVASVNSMEITDSGVPVPIGAAAGPVFTAEVAKRFAVPQPSPTLFYIRRGVVRSADGSVALGNFGSNFSLNSVAIAARAGGTLLAGTRNGRVLDVGTLNHGAQVLQVTLPAGPLSRPDWVPGQPDEGWVGVGTKLYRFTSAGKASAINLLEPSGETGAQIVAVRLSPEGSRVALVLKNSPDTAQIWIGAVVRSANQVKVDSLVPISPQGVDITDVAWNDALQLFAIGHDSSTGAASVYEVQADGSQWTADGIANLSAAPDSITAAQGELAAVGAGGAVWKQQASAWATVADDEAGAPVYSN